MKEGGGEREREREYFLGLIVSNSDMQFHNPSVMIIFIHNFSMMIVLQPCYPLPLCLEFNPSELELGISKTEIMVVRR